MKKKRMPVWLRCMLSVLLLCLLPVMMSTASATSVQEPPTAGCTSQDAATRNNGHHFWSYEGHVSPTCTAEGYDAYTCVYCDQTTYMTIPARGHVWSGWQTTAEATCTSPGSQMRTCSQCGAVETQNTAALGHIWGGWWTNWEADCTNAGMQSCTCQRCGETLTESIPALGHSYSDWWTSQEATCTEMGIRTCYCYRCGETFIDYIPALGHSYGYWETVREATCSQEGERKTTCYRCDQTVTEAIPKTEHTWGEWKVSKEAGDWETGLEERSCSVCGAKEEREFYKEGTVQNGETSENARELQNLLNAAGFDCGYADGIVGPKTIAAINAATLSSGHEAADIGWQGLFKWLVRKADGEEEPGTEVPETEVSETEVPETEVPETEELYTEVPDPREPETEESSEGQDGFILIFSDPDLKKGVAGVSLAGYPIGLQPPSYPLNSYVSLKLIVENTGTVELKNVRMDLHIPWKEQKYYVNTWETLAPGEKGELVYSYLVREEDVENRRVSLTYTIDCENAKTGKKVPCEPWTYEYSWDQSDTIDTKTLSDDDKEEPGLELTGYFLGSSGPVELKESYSDGKKLQYYMTVKYTGDVEMEFVKGFKKTSSPEDASSEPYQDTSGVLNMPLIGPGLFTDFHGYATPVIPLTVSSEKTQEDGHYWEEWYVTATRKDTGEEVTSNTWRFEFAVTDEADSTQEPETGEFKPDVTLAMKQISPEKSVYEDGEEVTFEWTMTNHGEMDVWASEISRRLGEDTKGAVTGWILDKQLAAAHGGTASGTITLKLKDSQKDEDGKVPSYFTGRYICGEGGLSGKTEPGVSFAHQLSADPGPGDDGWLNVSKEVVSPYTHMDENGEGYFVEGDKITYKITIKNLHDSELDVNFYDMPAEGDVRTVAEGVPIPAGESHSEEFVYEVTAYDCEVTGKVTNLAFGVVEDETGESFLYMTVSKPVVSKTGIAPEKQEETGTEKPEEPGTEKPEGPDPEKPETDPLEDDGWLKVTKEVVTAYTHTDENGEGYFVEGDKITYKITIENLHDSELKVNFDDMPVKDDVRSVAKGVPIPAGESRSREYVYEVTAYDCEVAGKVTNVAYGVVEDETGESFLYMTVSKPVVSKTGIAPEHSQESGTKNPEETGTEKPEASETETIELPGTERPKASETETIELPGIEKPGASETEIIELPGTEKPEVHEADIIELPVTEKPEVLDTEKPQVPEYEKPEVPGTEKPEVPEIERIELPDMEKSRDPGVKKTAGDGHEISIFETEISHPQNGRFYMEGETIRYLITVKNTGDTDVSYVTVFDSLEESRKGTLANIGYLAPGQSAVSTFEHTVTAGDVFTGYVVNKASAVYMISGGDYDTAVSCSFVSYTGGSRPVIVTGDGAEPEHIVIGMPDEFVPCTSELEGRAHGIAQYSLHSCTQHKSTEEKADELVSRAQTKEEQKEAWDAASGLWREEIDNIYDSIRTCTQDPEREILVLTERLLFYKWAASYENMLKLEYPDEPETVSREMAGIMMNRCAELCGIWHTAPKERADSYPGEYEKLEDAQDTEESIRRILDQTVGSLRCEERLSATHAMIDDIVVDMLGDVEKKQDLKEKDLEKALKLVSDQWKVLLNQVTSARYTRASGEERQVIAHERRSFDKWLEEYGKFLELFNMDTCADDEIIARTMMNRVIGW